MPWQLITRSLRRYPVRPPDSGIARRKSIWERIHLDPWLLGMLLVLMGGESMGDGAVVLGRRRGWWWVVTCG